MLKIHAFEIPAQLQQTIEDMRQQLLSLGKQLLQPGRTKPNQPAPPPDDKLIQSQLALVDADNALKHLRETLQQLDYSLNAGEPIKEPGNPVHPSADTPLPPDNTGNPWSGEFYN